MSKVLSNVDLESIDPFTGKLEDLPQEVKDCEKSIREDNPDMDKSTAIAICRDELNLADCPDGQAKINDECVAVEEVEAPPSLLNSQPRVMAAVGDVESEPIEREENGDTVTYKNIKLVSQGVWTDEKSKTPTLYNEETFKNTEPEWDESKYDGPPVNIHHDIYKDGEKKGEPHEASIGGHIDPESVTTDGKALFGDIVLDRGDDAGAFADTNLQSAIESEGQAGFSPSVELSPTKILNSTPNPRAEQHVKAAELQGVGLVRDPASKTVDIAHETRNRAVALSSSQTPLVYTLQEEDMSQELTAKVLSEFDLADPQDVQDEAETIADELDVPVGDVMEVLDPLFDMGEEEEGEEMADEEDEEEENEGEDNDEEEEDEGDDVEIDMEDKVASLEERISNLEGMVEEAMMSEDREELSAEIEEAKEELADAETVQELSDAKEELEKRLSKLEDEPEKTKTLADAKGNGDVDIDGPISQIESQRRY